MEYESIFVAGATVFTNMWSAVGEAGPQHGKVVMVPHIRFRSILT